MNVEVDKLNKFKVNPTTLDQDFEPQFYSQKSEYNELLIDIIGESQKLFFTFNLFAVGSSFRIKFRIPTPWGLILLVCWRCFNF